MPRVYDVGAGRATTTRGIIDRAIDSGIIPRHRERCSRGASEVTVGKALRRNGKRDRIVLATKVDIRWTTMIRTLPQRSTAHHRAVRGVAGASRVDDVNLYQIDRPSSDVPIDETSRALDDLIRAGKMRYAGPSTYAAWQLVEALWAARELGLNRFVTQPPYHLLDRRIERELVPFAQTYGTALIPWSPLAGGFLTGKYLRDESQSPEDSRYGLEPRRLGRNHFTDESFPSSKRCRKSRRRRAATPARSPSPGARTNRALRAHHRAAHDGATGGQPGRSRGLSRRERPRAPRRRGASGRATVPYYEADFGPHRFRW